jgi:beta-glucosidase
MSNKKLTKNNHMKQINFNNHKNIITVCISVFRISWANSRKKAPDSTPIITVNGLPFHSLNRDGKLDKYEDYRLSTQDRIQDLINKMTDDERQVCLESECRFDMAKFISGGFQGKVPGLQVGHLN